MTESYTSLGGISQTQDDFSVADFVARQIMNGMATATLVEVKAVHSDTVDVKPLVNQIDGAGTGIPHGIIHGLPVFAMRAGAAVIRMKPRAGDIGQVIFCHNDISTVKKTKSEANPSTRRRFDWSDGIYYGGFLPKSEPTVIIDVGTAGVFVTGSIDVTDNLTVGNGATGTFSTPTGQTVTVQNGIVTNIT